MSFRIVVSVVCVVALFYLLIHNYMKHKMNLPEFIITFLFFIGLFIVSPILNNFLSYDNSIIVMLIIYGVGISCEALYNQHRIKVLTRKIRLIKADK